MKSIFVEKNIPKMLLLKTFGPVWPGMCWTRLSPVNVADLPEPALPGPRWIRVKNRLCGICASDLSMLFVHVDPSVGPAALPGNQRFYLGHETVGEVAEAGPDVKRFKPGDRVIMDSRVFGPHCLSQGISPPCRSCSEGKYSLCENASAGKGPAGVGGGWGDGYTAHETEVFPVPQDVPDDDAVLMEPMAVSAHAVLRRPPAGGENVLVVGAGTIGLFVIQAARAACPGCRIAVSARYPHQREVARRFGADAFLDPGDAYRSAAGITGARAYKAPMNRGMLLGGFDVVYDCVGRARTVEDSLRWTRAGGTVVMVGMDLHRMRVDLNPVWYQEVDLIGSQGHGVDDFHGKKMHTYDRVLEWMRAGKMKTDGIITHRFPFAGYKRAVQTAASKAEGRAVKVVFDYLRAV
jgi:threonine dehydrogenase-like Zn-dependent dehydrogenase